MSSGKAILGLLAGIAAGALLGVMYAPEKGSVTRRKISQKGQDLAEDIKDKFNEFIEDIAEQFDSLENDAEDLSNKGTSDRRQ